ncbi:MAG: DUF5663 domain-containing protein [bacterium]
MSFADSMNSQSLLTALKLDAWPEQKKIKFLTRLSELVQVNLAMRLTDNLTEEQQAEVEKLSDTPDKLMDYLAGLVPNFNEIAEEEAMKIKDELIASLPKD